MRTQTRRVKHHRVNHTPLNRVKRKLKNYHLSLNTIRDHKYQTLGAAGILLSASGLAWWLFHRK